MKLISTKSFASALIVATLSVGAVSTAFADDAAATALAEAKKVTDVAKKAGFEWKNWGKIYKKAYAAIKDGKADAAIKIAKKLTFQGLAAQKQAEAAKTAGPRF
jgi:short-subunit dehydrogenase